MIDVNTIGSANNNDFNEYEFKKKLYAINLPKFEKQISKSYINNKVLECKTVENGIILPLRKTEIPSTDAVYEGGVCDESFNFIAGYKRMNNEQYHNFECIRSYVVSEEEIKSVNEEVVFAGIAYSHFGHFLVETMNRLWWIIKNNINNKRVVFLKNNSFDSSFIKLIELTGIKEKNIIFLDVPTQFKKVEIPDQSLCYFSYYHQEYIYPYQAIMDNIVAGNDRKIYLSRTKFIKKDCINEEYFEDFYRELGFKIVYPEQLDIKEQISIVSGADEIVSTMGTVSHLALFAKKGAKIITLLRARNYFNTTQGMVNQAKELDYTFVDVTCNFLPHRYSANCYYIGPNSVWVDFVKQEYDIEISTNILDYLNSNNSYIGDYFKQWIKIFSSQRQLIKIQHDNSLNILSNLQVVFADDITESQELSENIQEDLARNLKPSSLFTNKVFLFSRYDGTYARKICLNESGLIETISGKGHANESFWEVRDNELVFLNMDRKLTSRYFCNKEKAGLLFLLGYYEPNKEIIFKLNEVKITGLRAVKKN